MSKTKFYTIALMLGVSVQLTSCGGEEKKEEAPAQDTTKTEPKEPEYTYTHQVEEVTVEPRWAVTFGDSTTLAEINGDFYHKKFMALGKFVASKKMEEEPPFAIFDNFSETKKFYTTTGMFVSDSLVKVKAPMKLQKLYSGQALRSTYIGNYDEKIKVVYEDMMQYMKDKNLQPAGSPWEHYMVNPGNEKDSTKYQTDIYFPVTAVE